MTFRSAGNANRAVCVLALMILAAPGRAKADEDPTGSVRQEGGRVMITQTVETLRGEKLDLTSLRGSALLIVNTASECGYTPQYAGLQKLYDRYRQRGFVVIGFPSNDFGSQEPGTADQIAAFCTKNYGVRFPMMAKVRARGPEKAPIYKLLTEATPEGIRGEIRWNFTKFLVSPRGEVVARFEPAVEPLSAEITEAVEKVLPK